MVAAHEGPATVAAYSVVHDRDGGPARALLVCDLPGGAHLRDPDRSRRVPAGRARGARRRDRNAPERRVDGAFGPATVNRATVALILADRHDRPRA